MNPYEKAYQAGNPYEKAYQAGQEGAPANPLTDLGNLAKRGYAATAQGINWLIGSESGQDYWRQVGQQATAALSPEQQAASSKEFIHQKDPSAPWYDLGNYEAGPALSDWRSYTGALAESAPGTAMSMGVGGPLTKGLTAMGGKLLPLAEKGMQRLAMGAGAVGYGAGEGLIAGTTDATQARDEVLNIPPEQLAQTSELYRQRIASGLSPEASRQGVADAVAKQVGAESALAVGLTGAPMGMLMGKWFHGGGMGGSRAAGILHGTAAEAGQETLQSGAERYIQNAANQAYVDPSQPIGEGVANAAIAGGIAGGLMGGGIASVAPAQPTVSAANASPGPSPAVLDANRPAATVPATGPISRAVEQSPVTMEATPNVPQPVDEATQSPDSSRPESLPRPEVGDRPSADPRQERPAQLGPETVGSVRLARGQSVELSPLLGSQTARPAVTAEEQARLAEKMGMRPARQASRSAPEETAPTIQPESETTAVPAEARPDLQPQPEIILNDSGSQAGQAQAKTQALLNQDQPPLASMGAESPNALGNVRTEEIPVSRLRLSEDVPQFKSGANDKTGVVEPLGGKYERTGTAPIVVWERSNGQREVISGRHRLDLARRSGEATIPAQVLREADGFTAQKAAILDAELNIRDGQGKVKDYVQYFQHAGLSKEETNLRGLVSRPIGQRAFAVATDGTESLVAAHRADRLSDDAAYRIAQSAPRNERLQAVGIKAIQDGKSTAAATNLMQAVKAMAAERGATDSTGDLFGFDDSALHEAEAMAKVAAGHQHQLSEQLAAVQGAAKRPEQAKKLGVDVADPQAVRAKIAEIKAERDAWENWSSRPDLVSKIRDAVSVRASVANAESTNPKGATRTLAARPEVKALGERIAVVERQAELRPELQPRDGGAVKAVIDGNKIVLVGEHWTADDLANIDGVLQHEGGVHLARDSGFYDPQVQAAGKVLRAVGLKSLAGEASWSDVTRKLDALRTNGNASVRKAFDAAERAGASPELLHEEALGYLAELNPKHSVVRRLLATIKAALYRMGVNVKLGDAELLALARIGLRSQQSATPQARAPMADARHSRARAWAENLPAEVGSMADKIGAEPKPLAERLTEMKGTLTTRLRQGLVDRFARLAELDQQRFGADFLDTHTALSAWVAAKMGKSPDGALEAAFLHGELKWEDGALNVKETGKGLVKALEPVAQAGELNRFWQWIIANRAALLKSQGREHLFTNAEILAGRQLNQGQTADGQDRAALYQQVFDRYRAIQKSVLDVAQQAGLFDAAQRQQWEHDFYLPFYRVAEDAGEARGPVTGGKLVRQKAFEKLKGGTEKLGDPLQNILKNWHHLIDASLKNRAATLALDTAAHLGVAKAVPEALTDKNSVWVMQNGKKQNYNVSDPLALEAISAISAPLMSGGAIKALAAAKRALTLGVTISPAFKISNLLRDSIAALAVSRLSPNLLGNVTRGLKAAREGSATQAALLAGGGTFRFGTLLEGDRDAAARRIAGFQPDTVLDSSAKIHGLFALMKKGLEGWNRVGDRLETANRAAIYQQLRKEGKTHLQASLAARDLMDFSQSGGWAATRFLINMVPFLNARLQGLDVLYRKGLKPLGKAMAGRGGAMERQQAARFSLITFAVSAASALLYLAFKDDEDFKNREQWDRDTYWWFKVPGVDQPFRIPKPFEVGALGTLAERLVEQMIDPKVGGQLFADRLGAMLTQTFAFDPTPQLIRPILDVYANRDPFTGRPIETMGMERLSPELRRRYDTSALATGLSQAGLDKVGLSPVQIEHLIRGYFGWIGSQSLLLGDQAARAALGLPSQPEKSKGIPVVGDLIQRFAPDGRGSRYLTEFYDQLKIIRQVHADAELMQKLGDSGLSEFVQSHRKELALAKPMEQAARSLADLGQMERKIANSQTLSGAEKQARIDALLKRKSTIAQRLGAALTP